MILISLFCCLEKGLYNQEHMNELEKFNEIPLSKKQDFFNKLNMEDIANLDYNLAKKCKEFQIKNLGVS